MGTITGYTAEFIDLVLNGTVKDAEIIGGDLVFTKADDTTFNVGSVQGPQGDVGPAGPTSIVVCTSVTRPSGGALFEGLFIYETDTDKFYSWNGTFWFERGVGMIFCTSGTRPSTNLYNGMRIYETDTKRQYIHDGSVWVYAGGPAGPAVVAPSLQNSWVNFGTPWLDAGYYKDASGVVHLQGCVKSGTATAGTNIFTLPAGYRPAGDCAFDTKHVEGTTQSPGAIHVIGTGGSAGQVQIGQMSGISSFNDAVFLDSITFLAA